MKIGTKSKPQKPDKQKFTGKLYYGKGCVSRKKQYRGVCGEVFYGISSVWKNNAKIVTCYIYVISVLQVGY